MPLGRHVDGGLLTMRDQPESESAVKCSACGTRFTSSAWARLDLSTLIGPPEIRELVVGWPDDVCVEVRVCSRCHGSIAKKQRRTSIG
jgi:hypothetical protein